MYLRAKAQCGLLMSTGKEKSKEEKDDAQSRENQDEMHSLKCEEKATEAPGIGK